MSKKRFIKLMMARGYSRNLAAALATRVSQYGSYVALYQSLPHLGNVITMLRAACHGLAHYFDCAAVACTELAASMRRVAGGQEATEAGHGQAGGVRWLPVLRGDRQAPAELRQREDLPGVFETKRSGAQIGHHKMRRLCTFLNFGAVWGRPCSWRFAC